MERRLLKILKNMLVIAMTAASLAVACGSALAQQTVRVGVVAEFSGPFADYGTQIVNGMKTYLKLHGETFGGRRSRSSRATRPGLRRRSPSALRRN